MAAHKSRELDLRAFQHSSFPKENETKTKHAVLHRLLHQAHHHPTASESLRTSAHHMQFVYSLPPEEKKVKWNVICNKF